MQNSSKSKYLLQIVFATFLFSPGLFLGNTVDNLLGETLLAQEAKKSKKKTRRTPAMREKVYSQLARAQKLADEDKSTEGLEILTRLQKRSDQLNSYERAMMWNFTGFIHYGNNNTAGALAAFKQVVEIKNIPESLELSTLYSLAQLHMQAEKYQDALTYVDRWAALNEKGLTSKALVLQANAHYAMKNYQPALKAISGAVDELKKAGKPLKENWLVLKRALHYELKQPEAVTKVSEELVRHFPKPKYWVELANMYGEVGKTRQQLAVLEAAYQQGYVSKKADFQSLAQLYYFSGAPYKAAELMTEQLSAGVLEKDVATLRFLAQAWSTAKENKKAVPVLREAAKISEDGNMDARLAEVLINLEKWQESIQVAESAIAKGKLDNPGNVDVALGMAYFNLKKYSKAIKHFRSAKKQQNTKKMAEQWLRFVEREKLKQERLKESMASLG